MEKSPEKQKELLKEADQLRDKANELRKQVGVRDERLARVLRAYEPLDQGRRASSAGPFLFQGRHISRGKIARLFVYLPRWRQQ